MENYNVSGVVILCQPSDVKRIQEAAETLEGVESHFCDESGKIVVTLETNSIDNEIKMIKQLESIPGVISAQMVYSYHSNELEALRENISDSKAVLDFLNNENIKAQDIVYRGDAQKMLDKVLKEK